MKITYNLERPKSTLEKLFAITWTYAVPLFFLPVAGVVQTPLNIVFFIVGSLPLFVRFEL